ncbi:LysE family translocator [Streptomyces nodosus]|uniref:LysE family translocator n=1 Tax=Streptomyces nodosus TaxID=40318 RepID=A0A0B5DHG9_9ACTN|nr:LysE family translocator [Streptomyces nodosus]AJE43143.1 threonine transporter RhtB [Streptomyces nodosus]MBB4794547.1 threonine/homoserine/homoserine lactone efflux protein [Streptomyces nodosus]QEV41644.1 LysE family translocator [Streptomyces nodosus]
MLIQFLAAAGVLAVLTVVPGPDMAVVTKRAVSSGWRDGLRTVGGITAGLLVWGVLAVAGLAAVLAASATAYTVVKLVGAAYLVFLGVQTLLRSRRTAAVTEATAAAAPVGNPWRTGLVSNLFNPKMAVFYTGLLPTLAPSGLSPHTGMALLVLVHAVLTAGWLGGYALLLAKARAVFEKPAVRRGMDRVTGVVLIGFGLKVATTQP